MPLTVVTALTASRLDQLQHQCASWKGPLSAAVYAVIKVDGSGADGIGEVGEQQLKEASVELAELHKRWAGL